MRNPRNNRHLYRGPRWKEARDRVRERAGDLCEDCGARNGCPYSNLKTRAVVVVVCGASHLVHEYEDLDRFYDPGNMRWRCAGCHLRFDAAMHATNARETRLGKKERQQPYLHEVLAVSA